MLLTPLAGQFHLFLTLGKSCFILVREFVDAMGAGDAFNIGRMVQFFFTKRQAAGMAHVVITRFQPMANGHAMVEDKAFAMPFAILSWDLLQIF